MPSRCCVWYVSKSGRPSSGHGTRNGQSSSQFPRRVVLKNVLTIGQLYSSPMLVRSWPLIILHAKLQHYVNQELPDVQAGFRKGWGTRDQIATIHWIIEKAREFQKNIYLCFIDYAKAFDCVDHNKLWKAFKEMGIPCHLNCLQKTCMWVKKQQLEPCREQLIGWRLRKEYDRAVCCHPVCLIYMLSTSWEMLGWMSDKLESR